MVEFDAVGAGALGTAGVGATVSDGVVSVRYYREQGRTHRSLTERARQILRVVDRWLPHREKGIVADSRFAALELLATLPSKLHMVTRLRLDAALYGPVPERRAGQPGRPRKKGQRLPTLAHVLADPATGWTPLTLPRWYRQGERTLTTYQFPDRLPHRINGVEKIPWEQSRD